MIEYTTKSAGLAKTVLTLKTDNFILLSAVEEEIKKAKSKEDGLEYVAKAQEDITSLSKKDEKKTITITIEMS